MTLTALKEKVDILEKTLLAIDSINNICQQAINNGNQPIDAESSAYLLNHLIEPAMYQVEAVRMHIESMANGEQHVLDR